MKYKTSCRYFTGYKPCKYKRSCEGCPHFDEPSKRILIVSLEAMGAVLRSTCLLPALSTEYGNMHVTWLTLKMNLPLLANNPYIDRTIYLDASTSAILESLQFDIVFGVDKSLEAGALVQKANAIQKFGFGLDSFGAIAPLSSDAEYQFDVGLNDNLKFFENTKPETQQLTESMGLEWKRDPYVLSLTVEEQKKAQEFKRRAVGQAAAEVIGYNTGCSTLFPYKKLTVKDAIIMVSAWRQNFPDAFVFLLGGPQDTQRHIEIKQAFAEDPKVFNTPTTHGLREGLLWESVSDVVFSGCSLGMHISIALQKPTIAWFGLSCAQEVDLYDKGVKIQADVTCSPCWKKSCDQLIKCYEKVPVDKVMAATKTLLSQNV